MPGIPSTPNAATLRWRMLSAVLYAQVTVSIITQGVPAIAPFLQTDFNLTLTQVGMLVSAISMGNLATLALAGLAIDRFGERSMILMSNVVVSVAAVAATAFHSFSVVLVMLVLVGVGMAVQTPAGSRVVMQWFPPTQRGMAMGIRQTGISLGSAVAAALLPLIALPFGWRASMWVAVALCLTGAMVVILVYRGLGEQRQAPPSTRTGTLREAFTRDVVLMGLAGVFMSAIYMCLGGYLVLYLNQHHGLSIQMGALFLMLTQLCGTAGRIGWGVISDRHLNGRRKPALITAIAIAAIFSVIFGLLPTSTPLAVLFVVLVIFGTCASGWQGLFVSMISELAPPSRQGRTLGLVLTIMQFGVLLGPPLFGYVVDITGAWSLAWNLVGLSGVIGIGILLLIQEREKEFQ